MNLIWIAIAFVFFWNYNNKEEEEEDYDSYSESESELESDEESEQEEYEEESEQEEYEEEELIEYKDIPYKKGWHAGSKIVVHYSPDVIEPEYHTEDNFYEGKIRKKKGDKWEIYYHLTKNTDVISPLEVEWYYDTDIPLDEWDEPVTFTLQKKTLQPFGLKKERFGNWNGAKTCATVQKDLRIWTIRGTDYVYVGHLGVFELVSVAEDGSLIPWEEDFGDNWFIGKRKNQKATHFRDFSPLHRSKPIEFDSYDRHESTLKPLYPTLTREELN